MKNCPKCGVLIGDAATQCLDCDAKIPAAAPVKVDTPPAQEPKEDLRFAALFWGAFGLSVLYIGYVYHYDSGASRSVPTLVKIINREHGIGDRPCRQLGQKGEPAYAAVSELTKKRNLRACALEALKEMHPTLAGLAARPGLPGFLLGCLQDPNHYTHDRALWLMQGLGAQSPVAALIALLKDNDADVRTGAINAILEAGRSKGPVPGILVVYVRDNGRLTRAAEYGQVSGAIGPAAIPDMITLLKSNKRGAMNPACRALGAMGPAAKAAIPDLSRLLDAEDAEVRENARSALRSIQIPVSSEKIRP